MAADQGWFYRELGRRLHTARKEKRISQEAIGNAAGLTRSSIANIEKGRQPVQVHALCRMAAAIGIEITELIPKIPKVSLDHLPNDLRPEERKSMLRILAAAATERPPEEKRNHGTTLQRGAKKSVRTVEAGKGQIGSG
jgi:transcriptional regulator with XRE-family HTH domain